MVEKRHIVIHGIYLPNVDEYAAVLVFIPVHTNTKSACTSSPLSVLTVHRRNSLFGSSFRLVTLWSEKEFRA